YRCSRDHAGIGLLPEDRSGRAQLRTAGRAHRRCHLPVRVFLPAEPNPFPGVTPVEAGVLERTKRTQSEVLTALRSSFAYCDRAFSSASDTALVETVEFPASRNKIANKAFLLNLAFLHTGEHYGAMTPYLRSQGIVPPSTRRFSQAQGRNYPASSER